MGDSPCSEEANFGGCILVLSISSICSVDCMGRCKTRTLDWTLVASTPGPPTFDMKLEGLVCDGKYMTLDTPWTDFLLIGHGQYIESSSNHLRYQCPANDFLL